MKTTLILAFVFFTFSSTLHAQTPSDAASQPRIDIGRGFSVATPTGPDWQPSETPLTFVRKLGPENHTLVLAASSGPSGISHEDIVGLSGKNGGEKLIKLISRFVEQSWKLHAAIPKEARFELIDIKHETGGTYSFGKFFCGYSRIVVRDTGALADGVPMRMRYVAYSCIEFPDMKAAATVTYSERGREQDLSDDAMAEGEKFARSLLRTK